jgi:hypothetical protein
MKRTLMALLAGVVFVLLLSPSAQAAPTCVNQAVTVGFSCSLGAVTFTFEVVSLGGSATAIQLETPSTGIFGNDYNLDFQITAAVPPTGDFHIVYEVTGGSFTQVDNSFGRSLFTGSSINETVCAVDPEAGLGGCSAANTLAFLGNTTGALEFSTPFAPHSTIWIDKDVTDNGFSSFSDSVVSPEPATALLLGSALLGLGVLGRRKFRG